MIPMGGHRQPRSRPAILAGQDRDGRYEAACVELANTLGWDAGTVCRQWSQLALLREYECGQSRDVAEDGAFHNVCEVFDQRGRPPC